jgi:hypothetical protein
LLIGVSMVNPGLPSVAELESLLLCPSVSSFIANLDDEHDITIGDWLEAVRELARRCEQRPALSRHIYRRCCFPAEPPRSGLPGNSDIQDLLQESYTSLKSLDQIPVP